MIYLSNVGFGISFWGGKESGIIIVLWEGSLRNNNSTVVDYRKYGRINIRI